jgi:DNA-directed RNA polymerase subunit beta'
LVDVAQDSIITEGDCGTLDGIEMTPLVEGGEVIEGLGDRVLGRVALEDIRDPFNNAVLVRANEEINEERVRSIEDSGLERVKIRSVLTCQSRRGVCSRCYGRDLARGHIVNLGEAIGVIAAQSIGEPGTQLTMRTFHIGGTASRRAEQTTLEARNDGNLKFINLVTVTNKDGDLVVMNRNGELAIVEVPEPGRERERERYAMVYGARLKKKERDGVKAGELLAEWDPYTIPILTEVPGTVKFGDVLEGVTMEEKVDEATARVHQGCRRQDSQDGEHRQSGALPLAGWRAHPRHRRTAGQCGRRSGENPARDHQDEGHHRRSSARGGVVRSAQAEGIRDHQRDRRNRFVRQGHQG